MEDSQAEYRVPDLPEGESGKWRIERFEITEEGAKSHNLCCHLTPGGWRRTVRAGTYTRLKRGSTVVMSDTDAEIDDHTHFIHMAQGKILLMDLGLALR